MLRRQSDRSARYHRCVQQRRIGGRSLPCGREENHGFGNKVILIGNLGRDPETRYSPMAPPSPT